jgi:hypothetical protein
MSMEASSTVNGNKEPLYWSRYLIKDERETLLPVIQSAKIISLSDPNDPTNDVLHRGPLPDGAQLLQIGTKLTDFDIPQLVAAGANTVFVSHSQARPLLAQLLDAVPTLSWIQSRNAGIDSILSSTVTEAYTAGRITMTNAKGQFSSSLAEHALAACSYFAKDYPRLRRNQQAKQWDQYVPVLYSSESRIEERGCPARCALVDCVLFGMKSESSFSPPSAIRGLLSLQFVCLSLSG